MVGKSLGPYKIIEALGAGGMGEVYLAEDTRLERKVAIKVLPAELHQDAERRERFEREAKVISSLGHPGICSLFDVGSEDGVDFLVMELLDGETLGDRLEQGALPLDEALKIGEQIAEGLGAAHRAGVVHRDLKPGNVMLTSNGAKILDFGLAKPAGPQQMVDEVTVAATRMEPITTEGTIVGTLHYMSPEQLEGKDVDPRSDIFALGVLLYEMITGRRPFDGESQASLIGSILKDEPRPVTELREIAPRQLDHVVRRCLDKKPERRWQSSRDVAGELEWIRAAKPESVDPTSGDAGASSRRPGVWAIAAAAITVAVIAVAWSITNAVAPPGDVEPVTFTFTISDDYELSPHMAFRPDGGQIAYILTAADGTAQVWLRDMDVLEARPVPGTEGATDVFYKPDGSSLGFFADGQLSRIDLASGRVQRLGRAPTPGGGSWGSRGDIIYASNGVVWRVTESGGGREQVTELDPDRLENHHDWPFFLPDGDRYLLQTDDPNDRFSTLQMRSLSSDEIVDLDVAPTNAQYAAGPGLLLYQPRRAPFSVAPFDIDTGAIAADAIPVEATGFALTVPHRRSVTLSSRGDMALQPRDLRQSLDLIVYDLEGRELERLPAAGAGQVSISADGTRLVVEQRTGDERFLALIAPGLAPARLTSGSSVRGSFYVSADGSTLVFAANRGYVARSLDDNSSVEIDLPRRDWNLEHVSADGSTLLVSSEATPREFALAPVDGSSPPRVVGAGLESTGVVNARLSPDAEWIAFAAFGQTSTPQQVYVHSTRDPERRFQVSTDGGGAPFWAADGRTLYYIDRRDAIVEVRLDPGGAGPSLPQRLFNIVSRSSTLRRSPCSALTDDRFACLDFEPIPQSIEVRLRWADTLPQFR